MKHHLNIIIVALRVILFVAGIMCVFNLGQAYGFIHINDQKSINDFFLNYFTQVDNTAVNQRQLLGASYFFNTKWLVIGFLVAYTALLIYGMTGIVRLYKCLVKIEKGKMFYNEQGVQLRKAGATIIIFAKVKYVLFCFTGIMSYLDITTFFKQIPAFLTLYLVGKLILIMSYIAEKGEFIKEENELTI